VASPVDISAVAGGGFLGRLAFGMSTVSVQIGPRLSRQGLP